MTENNEFFDRSGLIIKPCNDGKAGLFNLPGGDSQKEISGVVVGWRLARQLYEQEFENSQGSPPICFATLNGWPWADPFLCVAESGTEFEGTVCEDCEKSASGSYQKFYENPKASQWKSACQKKVEIAVILHGYNQPVFVFGPVTAVTGWQKYCMSLEASGKKPNDVVTRFFYEQAKNATGLKYKKLAFEFVEDLEERFELPSPFGSRPAPPQIENRAQNTNTETDEVPF